MIASLPICVGSERSNTFYLYPLRRTWWEGKVQDLPRARKRPRGSRGLASVLLTPAAMPGWYRSRGTHRVSGMPTEPRRAAWCYSASLSMW